MERALDTGDANAIVVPRYPSNGGEAEKIENPMSIGAAKSIALFGDACENLQL